MKSAVFLPISIILLTAVRSHTSTVSVVDYGAVADGVNYDTHHIQSAIDECWASGGGRVIFPPGTYLTATIQLKSGVVLEIQVGARVLGGTRLEDYPHECSRWYVVLAENATDVGITGGGSIEGQVQKFIVKADPKKNVMISWNSTGACLGDECRPRLVGFLGCRDVHIWNINFTEPAYWCLHIVRSENTTIHDVSIYGDFNVPNNDGIDIEDSNNTIIKRCRIDTGDDGICPKSSKAPVYNLTVTDCWIRSKSSAIKLGSASFFEFKHFHFDNITIVESHRGLALQLRDGGNASDITFSNIKLSTRYYDPSWWGRAEPIYVTTCQRDRNSKIGRISDVVFVNISAVSENGILLSGTERGSLRNVRLENLNLSYRKWSDYAGGMTDYRPGCRGLVKHSNAGMMVDHVDDLVIENVNMWWGDGSRNWNNPLNLIPSKVHNISLFNFHSVSYLQ